jgi:hypothetical protein
MDVGSADIAWSKHLSTHMDVGSADIAWSKHLSTHMARIVPTILLHFLHPWRFTGIVPDNSQHTTHTEVGSAENAGAIFSHSIHGDKKRKTVLKLLPTNGSLRAAVPALPLL